MSGKPKIALTDCGLLCGSTHARVHLVYTHYELTEEEHGEEKITTSLLFFGKLCMFLFR